MNLSAFISYGCLEQKELPMHRNPGMEIVLVTEGRLRWRVDGVPENIPAGSVFFTLPWQAHGSEYVHEPGNQIYFIQFQLDRTYRKPVSQFLFHPTLGVPEREARPLSRLLTQTARHSWPASPTLQWLMTHLVEQLESKESPLFIRGLFQSLLAELGAMIDRGSPNTDVVRSPTEQNVEHLAETIRTTCEENWPLSRMERVSELGTTRLTDCFKKLTGDSPVAYLKRARVLRAEALLRDTDRTMTDIAFECGFSSSQSFCRTFRAYTNRSPGQYRKEARSRETPPVQNWSLQDERERREAIQRRKWL